MARTTGRSLAGTAAAAARKVMSRKSREDEAEPAGAEVPVAKKAAPAKKAVGTAKKTVPAKKAVSEKAVTSAKTSAAASVSEHQTSVTATKKTAATKTATKKTAATKTAAKRAPAKKATTTKAAPTKIAPTKSAQTKTAPTKTAAKKAPVKKAVVKKVAAAPNGRSGLAVGVDESGWTKAELDEVLAELDEHAVRLREELREQEDELAGLMRDAGDGAGHDQADMGATSFERDQEIIVVNNARDMLAQIERALGRIEDGSYGVCESCENPIGKMRLMAFPRATMCMPCKQREERR